MASDNETGDAPDRSTELARKIAQVLGCSFEALSSLTPSASDQTGDLLEIWFKIDHEQDRNKVLSYMRLIADQAAAR